MTTFAAPAPLIGRVIPAEGVSRILVQVLLAVAGTLLIWASAKIKVPFYPVPVTMQVFVIMGLAATYGLRLGLATILLYLAEGAMGAPVFTDTPEKGIGLAYMMQATGGYLAGFVVMTAIVGWFAERGFDRNPFTLFGVMLAGIAVMYALGLAWLGALFGWDKPILAWGFYPFILADLTKIALASCLIPAVARLFGRG
jgi:biotin transport system substrate-specific component